MAGNLLENAFKWARSTVVVRAGAEAARDGALTIDDDGAGLQPEQIPQVLRPGERLDETRRASASACRSRANWSSFTAARSTRRAPPWAACALS